MTLKTFIRNLRGPLRTDYNHKILIIHKTSIIQNVSTNIKVIPQRQPFPSRPIPLESAPVQKHFLTHSQVFGRPKNVFRPNRINSKTQTIVGVNPNKILTIIKPRISSNQESGQSNFISEGKLIDHTRTLFQDRKCLHSLIL